MSQATSRRRFLKQSIAATSALPFIDGAPIYAQKATSANDKILVGSIGTGFYRGRPQRGAQVSAQAHHLGKLIAIADVDKRSREGASDFITDGEAKTYCDYRKILENKDIDAVTIGTPDHWHAKIAIEALHAGKDVYCEKPLTLTIDEGKQIIKAQKKTGRVFQVGTQQRTEMGQKFLKAIALIRDGRIGKIQEVTCCIGGAPVGGPFKTSEPPSELDWEKWQGPAQKQDYIKERAHYQFRWWYEYSGGKMTDWGAHHVDIAQWAIGMDHSGPLTVEGLQAEHPVCLKNGMPVQTDRYNCANRFTVKAHFPNGVEMYIKSHGANGITFKGTKGQIFVSRGKLSGDAVDALKDDPLSEDAILKVYKGRQPTAHMEDFFNSIKTREDPISDVYTHHRAMTTCHLANIAIRLNSKLEWSPITEQITNDKALNSWLSRKPRKGYEIEV